MKFLICGIGSIGQRHYKNLKSLGHEVAAFRFSRTNTPFVEKFFQEQAKSGLKVKSYYNFEEAINDFNPDAVFVTNPNSRHIDISLRAARSGKHLFIEKPLSNNLDGLDELKSLAEQKKLKIMIGYNLRWHPLLKKMKTMVESGEIGKPISANIVMGENIEDWHPWEDYRTTYAAYKSGGGGAVLCFSHDIDYLYWFFGMPENIYSIGGKITPLDGDAEDMVKSILEYKNNFIVSLHLDYWQYPPTRSFEIIGTKGKMFWDYYAKNLTILYRDKEIAPTVINISENFDRNDMFIDEIKDFIMLINGVKDSMIPLNAGIDVLKIALEIKKKIGF
ncbi:MAG: Gfo/Idh/MocA family oxidoreductase [bacterium]|nr:Gfo/Idh/MocA family oxidoreductase [bacterium]